MTQKIINFTLSIILFIIPLAVLPASIYPGEYNIPKIVLLYICGAVLLICLLINYKQLKFDKSDKILLAFIVLIFISTLFSINIKKSIWGQSNRYEGLLTFLCYYLTYYCGKYYFKFNKKFIFFSLGVILITCIIAILQYYDLTFISDLLKSERTGNNFSSSTFGNRNFFGSFITIGVIYTMCLYIFYGKKIYLPIACFAFYALINSLTRSAWVAFFVISFIGIIYIIMQKDKKMLIRAGVLLILFIFCFAHIIACKPDVFLHKYLGNLETMSLLKNTFPVVKKENSKESTNLNDVSNQASNSNIIEQTETISNEPPKKEDARILIWRGAFRIIKDHPLLGCGPDTFLSEMLYSHTDYLQERIYPQLNGSPDKAHNEYLQIASTIGIPALMVYLTFLILTLRNLLKSNLKENKINFIIFLCLVGYLVQAFFNISTIGVAPIFYFLLGFSYQEKTFIEL